MALRTRRNRLAINLEDSVYEAFEALAEAEKCSNSELGRRMIITELVRAGLLPQTTIQRLIGVRT